MTVPELITEYPRLTILSVVVVANFLVALLLTRAALKGPEVESLKVMAVRAVGMSAGIALAFLLWLNIRLDFPVFDIEVTLWLGFAAILAMSLPSLWFLYLYSRNRFG